MSILRNRYVLAGICLVLGAAAWNWYSKSKAAKVVVDKPAAAPKAPETGNAGNLTSRLAGNVRMAG